MGALADRLAYLARRYGSDASAWQHELAAVAALEKAAPKEALDRFYALKRRFAEFRRLQLLDELRSYPFVSALPPRDTKGWPQNELEAEIRQATRALADARAIASALDEEAVARASLRTRTLPASPPLAPAAWDALGPLAQQAGARRRIAAREARLDRRLADAQRRARRVGDQSAPEEGLPSDALDAALDAWEARLATRELMEEAFEKAIAPLKTPEVASFRGESRRALEREARDLRAREDVGGLRALLERAEALRKEAAALASQAARSRRKGLAPPERERRSSDSIDGYG